MPDRMKLVAIGVAACGKCGFAVDFYYDKNRNEVVLSCCMCEHQIRRSVDALYKESYASRAVVVRNDVGKTGLSAGYGIGSEQVE